MIKSCVLAYLNNSSESIPTLKTNIQCNMVYNNVLVLSTIELKICAF